MNDAIFRLRHSQHLIASGLDDRALRRAAERGELVRVTTGTFVPAAVWTGLDAAARHSLVTVSLLRRIDRRLVASHLSAAAMWGFPDRSGWPDAVHVIDTRRRSGSRTPTLVRHAGTIKPDEFTIEAGVRVTTPVRTATDIALAASFATAVMTFDHGLRFGHFTRETAHLHLDRRPNAQRRRSARRALEIASPSAGSPAESLSRAAMIEAGLPCPVLQQPFRDGAGKIGDVDFWWPEFGVVGEMDGDQKYTDAKMLAGKSSAQAVTDEKRREDRLRALPNVRTVVRWGYREVEKKDELLAKLGRAGVTAPAPRERRWHTP